MKEKITLADVEHVARLSRLRLTSEEKEKFGSQLNAILDYMEKLSELDTEKVEPLSHVLPLKNVLRKDEVRPSLTQDEVLKNAPDKYNGFFKVPPVIE